MTHLRNFALKHQSKNWRVVCRDDADLQAATVLGYKITEERLHGKLYKIAFSSYDKLEASKHQQIITNESNKIRLPKGSDPVEAGRKIKEAKRNGHVNHQLVRRDSMNRRGGGRY